MRISDWSSDVCSSDLGAAKAVSFALGQLGIAHTVVSRAAHNGQLTYAQLDAAVIGIHPLIINTTPLGTYPDVTGCPDIPYDLLDDRHLLYDLVYNPPETDFLMRGTALGADRMRTRLHS